MMEKLDDNYDNPVCNHFDRIPARDNLTDGQADRQTSRHTDILPLHSTRYTTHTHTSCGKKHKECTKTPIN